MIEVRCPQCNRQMQIPDEYAGQKGRCSACGAAMTLPVLQAIAPTPPSRSADPKPPITPPTSTPMPWEKTVTWVVGIVLLLVISIPVVAGLRGITSSNSETSAEPSSDSQQTSSVPLPTKGNGDAEFSTGLRYAKGDSVPKDNAQAVSWFMKAADQGHALAQFNLGVCYETGAGVQQDLVQAAEWYRKAAEQGYALAQYNIGVAYSKGAGVTRYPVVAIDWWRKAAEQGNFMAQYNLGVCYAKGEGVPEDLVKAYMWMNIASASEPNGVEAMNRILPHMTPEQVAEAKRLSAEFAPHPTSVTAKAPRYEVDFHVHGEESVSESTIRSGDAAEPGNGQQTQTSSSDDPVIARLKAVGLASFGDIESQLVLGQIANASLEDSFAHIARGAVTWEEVQLRKDDAYYSTHDAVRVQFKDPSSRPITLLFLCERGGDAVLLQKAQIGNDRVEPMAIIGEIAGLILANTIIDTASTPEAQERERQAEQETAQRRARLQGTIRNFREDSRARAGSSYRY